jgi:hypothetical protein
MEKEKKYEKMAVIHPRAARHCPDVLDIPDVQDITRRASPRPICNRLSFTGDFQSFLKQKFLPFTNLMKTIRQSAIPEFYLHDDLLSPGPLL